MKNTIREQAITLISLVVTIIILLILAGVTIGVATNGTGLFEKAKLATDKYNNSVEKENDEITKSTNQINEYIGNTRSGMSYTVLFDSDNEGETALTTVNDYRTLENVGSYDFLLVYVWAIESENIISPKIVYKADYRKKNNKLST